MNHRLLRRLQPLLLAAATVLFAPTIVAAPLAFQATINFSEHVLPTGTETPCLLIGRITGLGIATKVGAITVTSTDCINLLSPTDMSFGFASHNVVLKASNGDQLFAMYSGILSAEGVITGEYTVYDGTGRFSNAKGSGQLSGFEMIDQTTGAGFGHITLQGVLAY